MVCYFGSWSVYRPGDGKFEIEYTDPNLCTHAIYTFVGIEYNGGVRILDSWNEIDLGKYATTQSAKYHTHSKYAKNVCLVNYLKILLNLH